MYEFVMLPFHFYREATAFPVEAQEEILPAIESASPRKLLRYFYFFAILKEMREHTYLGEFELVILLTVLRMGDEVYGVPLARELAQLRGGDVSIGSVYAALDRLELKGLITSRLGDPTAERGGRAKRYFQVSEQGLQSIRETRKMLTRLWRSLPATGGETA